MSYLEALRCTLVEFEVQNIAFRIKRQHEEYLAALNAYFSLSVQATEGSGENMRSKFPNFSDFYNLEEEFESVFKTPKEIKREIQQTKAMSIAEMNMRMKRGKEQRNER